MFWGWRSDYCGFLHFRARTEKNGPLAGRFSSRSARCCSALALIGCCGIASSDAQPKSDRTPLLLFPTRPVWTLALNNQITVAPASDATRAFFSIDGDQLVCYELLSGTQLWIANLRPTLEPVAGDGLLFIVDAATLTALRAEDGTVAWQLPFTEPLAVRPVWDNGWLVVSTSAGSVLAFRAADGHLIWSRDLGSPAHALPALAADWGVRVNGGSPRRGAECGRRRPVVGAATGRAAE